jgi:uncharacterized protein
VEQLEVYVDARLSGNQARFVRRSCWPNARVALIAICNPPERGIHFGLFATSNIKPQEEITIGFDWKTNIKTEAMISSIRDETRPLTDVYPREALESMNSLATTVLGEVDCACHSSHCLFTRLQSALESLSPRRRPSTLDTMSPSHPHSDDHDVTSEMDDDGSSRPDSRGKPMSRDRTPSKDLLVDVNVAKTAREQRKIDHALALFAQMEEKRKPGPRKKSDATELERKPQGSVTAEPPKSATAKGVMAVKGRGMKRKSMSPSPGADRDSESAPSANASPKPGGRVPNRVKRSLKGRGNKKVRVLPPEESTGDEGLPKWVERRTISDSWQPIQMLWFKKYAEIMKEEFKKNVKQEVADEIEVMLGPQPETTPSSEPAARVQNSPPTENFALQALPTPMEDIQVSAPQAKAPLRNLHVKLPPRPFAPSEHNPVIASTPSTASLPQLTPITAGLPPVSPLTITTPSTPKVKLTLADYRARRASTMAHPSLPTPTETPSHPPPPPPAP